jgi:hypothetical protein
MPLGFLENGAFLGLWHAAKTESAMRPLRADVMMFGVKEPL